jgi:hypothetical protein
MAPDDESHPLDDVAVLELEVFETGVRHEPGLVVVRRAEAGRVVVGRHWRKCS